MTGSVLIVGAGLAGMQAALLLAEVGVKVHLLDEAPGIGGSLHLLERTFPTDSCALCAMSPRLPAYCPSLECSRRENIELLPYAELAEVAGKAGDFHITIRHKPRFVLAERCTGCGRCTEVCPAERPADYEGTLRWEKAIRRPPARAVPEAFVIDMGTCTRCGRCVQVCPEGAIDLDMRPSYSELEAGAILLTPGLQPFNPRERSEYGYGVYPNVLTSLEFERMLSPSGFTGGRVLRASDGLRPRTIAFIQCVGSRDSTRGMGYCSSVCCMHTDKHIAWAKEVWPGLEAVVFSLDVRACGKGFEEYHERVAALPGVRYIRSMASAVEEVAETKDLRIRYVDEGGRLQEEEFDLMVLAVGLRPSAEFQMLAKRLGLALNEYGFPSTPELSPVETSRPGILIAGAGREPADIPRALIEAAAAAANALRFSGREEAEAPAEPQVALRDVSEEEPRIGVFLCTCGGEVSDVVALEEVSASLHAQDGVAHVEILPLACGPEGLSHIGGRILKLSLNRLVVAGCSDRLLRPGLEKAMEGAGLDGCLLETANIREQCAWVHQAEPRRATAKALNLLEMALAKVRYNSAGGRASYPIVPSALVVGGGLAGLCAALELAERGYPVHLVEKEPELGGNLRHIAYTLEGNDPAQLLHQLVAQAESHPRISIYRQAEVLRSSGLPGKHTTTVRLPDGRSMDIEHGVTVLATGGRETKTDEYLYGRDPRLLTQRELEARLAQGSEGLAGVESVVMVQCVGSREEGRPYCSQICCPQALKNALKMLELKPGVSVFILYRDIRTPGFLERYYERARDEGVVFIRYEPARKPKVEAKDGHLEVGIFDPILREELELEPDLLVLSVGVEPNDVGPLAQTFGLPLDGDGFFQEDNIKARPLGFLQPGFYLAGLARFPCSLGEALAQGQGAAMQAMAFLSQRTLEAQGLSVEVNPRLCGGCGLCVEVCPYGARALDEESRIAEVLESLCLGCGTCAAACPNGATQQHSYESEGMLAMIDRAFG